MSVTLGDRGSLSREEGKGWVWDSVRSRREGKRVLPEIQKSEKGKGL